MSIDEGRFRKAQRVRSWFVDHPLQALGLAAGAVAFCRLLAVSHFKLTTARLLLENSDLASLAAGLVLSAMVFWIPIVIAGLTFVGLNSMHPKPQTILLVVGPGAAVAYFFFDRVGLEVSEIAQGGTRYALLSLLIGIGIGAIWYGVVRARTAEIAIGATSTLDEPPTLSDEPVVEADELKTHEPSELGTSDSSDTPEDAQPSEPVKKWSRVKRGGKVAGTIVLTIWLLILALAFALTVANLIYLVLSEPSQAPENVTITTPEGSTTQTVHILDDTGSTWVIMLRDDRTVVSVENKRVTGRYICRVIDLDNEYSSRFAGVSATSSANSLTDELTDTAELILSEARDDAEARRWIKQVGSAPPPCELQWSAEQLAVIRAGLGLKCHMLDPCSS